jgi:hypothetical protein
MTAADLIAALKSATKAEVRTIRELLGFSPHGNERPTPAELTGDPDAGKGLRPRKPTAANTRRRNTDPQPGH